MSDHGFAALGLSADVVRALSVRGIDTPFHVQSRTIPEALRGGDVLVKSPTGSGKTIAFAAPIVERLEQSDRRPGALVLVPTRELALQVTEDLETLARAPRPSHRAVYGGVPLRAQAERARSADVLVATPGRLQDLVDRRLVSLDAVRILVLDEADRMLDMGFKPQVDRLVRRLPRERQTMFFSATLDGEVGELASQYTSSPTRIEAELPPTHAPGEVDHHFVSVTHDTKVEKLVELLTADRGLALVFVRTKRGADRLAQKLARHGVEAIAMHGDKNQSQREQALARFEQGSVTTLIATDVAARGARPRRCHARDQLRPARRRQGLHPPRRPHRPGGTVARGSPSSSPTRRRMSAASPGSTGSTTGSSRPACAPARRVSSTRRVVATRAGGPRGLAARSECGGCVASGRRSRTPSGVFRVVDPRWSGSATCDNQESSASHSPG